MDDNILICLVVGGDTELMFEFLILIFAFPKILISVFDD